MRNHGVDPCEHVDAVIAAASEAGKLTLEMRERGLQRVRSKSSTIDLVTEADVAAERLLRERLSALRPDAGFWGEESNQIPEETAFWVVDPIDGTNNYAAGLPLYAVNIAWVEEGEIRLGVTLEAPARRVYWAVADRGAYLRTAEGGERRLRVTDAEALGQAILSTGFPYHRAEQEDNNSAEYVHLLCRAQGVRCLGSAALDLAFVASGWLSGYWEAWLQPWDAAPGALLVREAGGRVTTYAGTEWGLRDARLIASNGEPALHAALLEGVNEARRILSRPLF